MSAGCEPKLRRMSVATKNVGTNALRNNTASLFMQQLSHLRVTTPTPAKNSTGIYSANIGTRIQRRGATNIRPSLAYSPPLTTCRRRPGVLHSGSVAGARTTLSTIFRLRNSSHYASESFSMRGSTLKNAANKRVRADAQTTRASYPIRYAAG